MPAINLYHKALNIKKETIVGLKDLTAELLSCESFKLVAENMSVRIINVFDDSYMIAPLECDIIAASFEERIKKQDEICNQVREYLLKNIDGIKDARVWLPLSELGHSF